MDYLFESSDPESLRNKKIYNTATDTTTTSSSSSSSLIQPNFVIATKGEPANGGVFQFEPYPNAYKELQQIVHNQRESAKDLGYPYFSKIDGWGHSFSDAGDEWQGTQKSGQRWSWHGVHSDQGLIYYWVRYHKQRYTAFRGHVVDNYVPGPNGQPILQQTMNTSVIMDHEPPNKIVVHHPCGKTDYNCRDPPYSNFRHMIGKSKAWQHGYDPKDVQRRDRYHVRAYFEGLFALSEKLGLGFTPDNVNQRLQGESPLGTKPELSDFVKRLNGEDEDDSNIK
jgi:hypothetical protein